MPSSRESYSVGLGYAVAGRTDLRPTRTGCTISDGVENPHTVDGGLASRPALRRLV